MKLSAKYELSTIAGSKVLVPVGQAVLDGEALFELNETGFWYVSQMGEGVSDADLLERACEHFEAENDADRELLKTELDAFLANLREQGILEV